MNFLIKRSFSSVKTTGALTKKEYSFSKSILKPTQGSMKKSSLSPWAQHMVRSSYVSCMKSYAMTPKRYASDAKSSETITPKLDTSIASSGTKFAERFQATAYVMMLALPAAILFSSTSYIHTIDLILGFAIPIHGYMGMKAVCEDYLGEAGQSLSGLLLLLLLALSTYGLYRLNTEGDGIVATVRSVWQKEKEE